MARVRLNTYADGTNSVTCKFWDIRLIPREYYLNTSACRINKTDIISENIIEY